MGYMFYTRGYFDLQAKIAYLIFGAAIGVTMFFSAYTDTYIPYKNTWRYYLDFYCVSDSYFEVVSGVLITIYALALPLSISTISEQLKPYKDEDLVFWIYDRWEVFYMRICLPLLIIYTIILSFLNIKNGIGALVTMIFSTYTIFITIKFFRLITSLIFNTEMKVLEWSAEVAKSKLL